LRTSLMLSLVALGLLSGCNARKLQNTRSTPTNLQLLAEQAFAAVSKQTGQALHGLSVRTASGSDIAAVLRDEQAERYTALMSDEHYAQLALEHDSQDAGHSMLGKYAVAEDAVLINPQQVARLFVEQRDNPAFMREVYLALLAHEAMHAAQHRRYDFNSDLLQPAGLGQRATLDAIVEGEAQFAARRACEQLGCERGFNALTEALVAWQPHEDAAISQRRHAASARIAFSYVDGEKFVETLYQQGGDALVEQLWHQPPDSPWVVINPGRFELMQPLTEGVDLERAAERLEEEFSTDEWVHVRGVTLPNEVSLELTQFEGGEDSIDEHQQHIAVTLLDKSAHDAPAPTIELVRCANAEASQRWLEAREHRLQTLDASHSRQRSVLDKHYREVHAGGASGFYRKAIWQIGEHKLALQSLMLSRGELSIHIGGNNLPYSEAELTALGERLLSLAESI
jgi:hypothetical protein